MILGTKDWIINAETHKDHFEKDIAFFKIIDSGHMSHISHTELVAKLLEEFVTSTSH
jgi:pimeloyl-ACP methyl ester carboxylesterase